MFLACLGPQLRCPFSSFTLSSVTASGDCYTFGSNQHGQLGTSARRVSRAPCQVQGLQGIKIVMVACGDAFTVAIGTGDERGTMVTERVVGRPMGDGGLCSGLLNSATSYWGQYGSLGGPLLDKLCPPPVSLLGILFGRR